MHIMQDYAAPAHSAFSGNVTLTLPITTDTILGRTTTDTLTNKSIDADNNTISNIEVDNLLNLEF